MARTGRPCLSAEQKQELWTWWKDGQSLSDIGWALGKHAASVFGVLAAKGGIAPPVRTRSRLLLTAEERDEVSRDLSRLPCEVAPPVWFSRTLRGLCRYRTDD